MKKLATNLFLCLVFCSCTQNVIPFAIKLLLLTPEPYLGKMLTFAGSVHSVSDSGLWFMLEDKTGFIQVTTENFSSDIACVQKGHHITLKGVLKQYDSIKYISMTKVLKCED